MTPKLSLTIEDQVLLDDIVLASTFTTKLFGYMCQKTPKSKGILFRHCNALHSYFMHFDLDLYFLDQDYQLVQKISSFQPNKMIAVPNAVHVLETPVGLLGDEEILLGQRLLFLP